MKSYISLIMIFATMMACNQAKAPANKEDLPPTDSSQLKNNSTDNTKIVKPENNIESQLTKEEMKDDTVFSDGSKPTSWKIAGITDVKAFKLFLKKVQLLVMDNDKAQLARLVKYPLGKSVKTEQDFIDNYDQVFSKDARLSIARINFSQLFRNYKGVMTENGKVWFAQEGKEFKIIAINN